MKTKKNEKIQEHKKEKIGLRLTREQSIEFSKELRICAYCLRHFVFNIETTITSALILNSFVNPKKVFPVYDEDELPYNLTEQQKNEHLFLYLCEKHWYLLSNESDSK